MLRIVVLALVLLAPLAAGAGTLVIQRYSYEPPTTLTTTSAACEEPNVHCFALVGAESSAHVSILDDANAVLPIAEVAAFVRLSGGEGFRAGIMCGEVRLPTEGATTLSVHLLPAAAWRCDWCPDGSTATQTCPRTLPVSAQPTRGLLIVEWS